MRPESCDIFCRVVDNFGDIGVCWRLSRQLANEYGVRTRLMVDDLASFQRIAPTVVTGVATQRVAGVEVLHWHDAVPAGSPADLVIEAFACELPGAYQQAMAQRAPRRCGSTWSTSVPSRGWRVTTCCLHHIRGCRSPSTSFCPASRPIPAA